MGAVACTKDGSIPFFACSKASEEWSRNRAVSTNVLLHIYDIGPHGGIVNNVLRPLGTGMFHCGVEVYGWEWAFTDSQDIEAPSGIFCSRPRECEGEGFTYRETIDMGTTRASESMVRQLVRKLEPHYSTQSYDVLLRNCCHFSDEFCQLLGVGSIPPWVCSLATAGASLEQNRRDFSKMCRPSSLLPCCCAGSEGFPVLGGRLGERPMVVSVDMLGGDAEPHVVSRM